MTNKNTTVPGRLQRSAMGPKLSLAAPERAGYHRHWVNDDGEGSLERAEQEKGYTFVTEKTYVESDAVGSRIAKRVGTKKDGSPLMAYLMETPQKWYDQYQQQLEDDRRQAERLFNEQAAQGEKGQLFEQDGSGGLYRKGPGIQRAG